MKLNKKGGRKRKNFYTLFIHQRDARRRSNQVAFSLRFREFQKDAESQRVS